MFIKISEQPSLYNDLEKKSIREILEDINAEDQKVALATQKAIPQIEKLVSQIVPRMAPAVVWGYSMLRRFLRHSACRLHWLSD